MKTTIVETDAGLFRYEGILWINHLDKDPGYIVLIDGSNDYPIKINKADIVKITTKKMMTQIGTIEDHILYEREAGPERKAD